MISNSCKSIYSWDEVIQEIKVKASDDYLYEFANTVFKVVTLVERNDKLKERLITEMKASLESAPVLLAVREILFFQVNYPQIFEKRQYDVLLDWIQQHVCKKFTITIEEIVETINRANVPPDIKERDFSWKNKKVFVLGCGHVSDSCQSHEGQLTLDIDPETKPDILASYDFLKDVCRDIPNETFEEIFYEGFCPGFNFDALKKVANLLKKDGVARMPFRRELTIFKAEGILEEELKKCGFDAVEIREESFKSCGLVSLNKMVYCIKRYSDEERAAKKNAIL